MGVMVEGEWSTEWYEPDEKGAFIRPDTVFHGWVERGAGARFAPEPGRYHLYVSLACPWAHRTLIVRALRGLEDVIDVSVVHPIMTDDGWHFDETDPRCTTDEIGGHQLLRNVYLAADDHYSGRVTVPILWDRRESTIVSNESREIICMLDQAFSELSTRGEALFPEELDGEIEAMIEANYGPVNDGVYRCGFSGSQSAYEAAAGKLFARLDELEEILGQQRFLCGDRLTAADVCLFTTLFRFDPVYYTHFKTNLRRLRDYPNLWNYTLDIHQTKWVRETCDLWHCKQHYFRSHPTINPSGIVPIGPEIDYDAAHDRDRFS